MPIVPDLVGPRSDHIAFLAYRIPCVFFTCGVFDGYHTESDTPNLVDYDALAASLDVIDTTVRALATVDRVEGYAAPAMPDPEELTAIATTLAAARDHASELRLSTETNHALDAFLRETITPCLGSIDSGFYTFERRAEIAESMVRVLGENVGTLLLGEAGPRLIQKC